MQQHNHENPAQAEPHQSPSRANRGRRHRMMQTAIGMLLIAVISLASCRKTANTAPAYTDRERLLLDTTNNHTRNIDSLMVLVNTYSKQGDRCREMAALAALGHGYQTSNRYSDAVKAHQKQLTIAEELDDTLMKASALNDLGVNYRRLGLHYDGLDYHLRAVETSLLYPDNKVSRKMLKCRAIGYNGAGNVYLAIGSYQKADEMLRKALAVETRLGSHLVEQLEGMIGTLRVFTSRLATKESYWIFSKEGDDFDLKVSDPKNPSYLLIANDPEMESIIGALNALILNRLVTRVNTGQGKNVPVSIIVDELPTLYFHKIDRLIGTARSNKVSVTLGFQELPQLEADYGKTGMQKIITTVGNVISGSARAKETLEWLSNDIFGKVVQLKKGVTIDRDRTSININENMDSLVPGSKIADMPTGWICGQTARDFVKTKTGRGDSMDIQEAEEFQTSKFFCKTDFNMEEIGNEEKDYAKYPLPKFYKFPSVEAKERILYANFLKINKEVKDMIAEIQEFNKK